MSKEYHRFLESVSKTVKLVDGHYSFGLPLKDEGLEFPNNRCVAEQSFKFKTEVSVEQHILPRVQSPHGRYDEPRFWHQNNT